MCCCTAVNNNLVEYEGSNKINIFEIHTFGKLFHPETRMSNGQKYYHLIKTRLVISYYTLFWLFMPLLVVFILGQRICQYLSNIILTNISGHTLSLLVSEWSTGLRFIFTAMVCVFNGLCLKTIIIIIIVAYSCCCNYPVHVNTIMLTLIACWTRARNINLIACWTCARNINLIACWTCARNINLIACWTCARLFTQLHNDDNVQDIILLTMLTRIVLVASNRSIKGSSSCIVWLWFYETIHYYYFSLDSFIFS